MELILLSGVTLACHRPATIYQCSISFLPLHWWESLPEPQSKIGSLLDYRKTEARFFFFVEKVRPELITIQNFMTKGKALFAVTTNHNSFVPMHSNANNALRLKREVGDSAWRHEDYRLCPFRLQFCFNSRRHPTLIHACQSVPAEVPARV